MAKYKSDKAKAEADAMKAATDKNHVPESVWSELRAEHKRKMAANV